MSLDEHGTFLPAACIFAFATLSVAILVFSESLLAIRLTQDAAHLSEARRGAKNHALSRITGTSEENTLRCRITTSTVGKFPARAELCEILGHEQRATDARDLFGPASPPLPLVDWTALFREAYRCPSSTLSGSLAAAPALQSALTCRAVPSGMPALLGNLLLNDSVLLSSPTPLAVTGRLDASALKVAADTLIVAGGDIRIGTITSELPRKVTIVSATGAIEIAQVNNLTLSLFAHAGYRIPPGTRTTRDTETLSLLPRLVISLDW